MYDFAILGGGIHCLSTGMAGKVIVATRFKEADALMSQKK